MGLLATLNLVPTAAMRQASMVAMAMPPSQGSQAAAPRVDPAWAVDPSVPMSHPVQTLYGTFFVDDHNRGDVMPWLEDTLTAFPKAKASHGAMLKAAATVLKVKAVLEAQPHTVDEIQADVTRHADPLAANAGGDVRTAQLVGDAVLLQIKGAKNSLVELQARWVDATGELKEDVDRADAKRIRAEVKEEKEFVDLVVGAIGDLFGACESAASDPTGISFTGAILSKVIDLIQDMHAYDRLARADALEKKADEMGLTRLKTAIGNASSHLKACSELLGDLEKALVGARAQQVLQRDKAAVAFDAGSKRCEFRLSAVVKAIKGAEALSLAAETALRDAVAAAGTAGALVRRTPVDTENYEADRAVVDQMLLGARRWKESAEKEVARSLRLIALWSSLSDAAVAAMNGATGHGQSLKEAFALP